MSYEVIDFGLESAAVFSKISSIFYYIGENMGLNSAQIESVAICGLIECDPNSTKTFEYYPELRSYTVLTPETKNLLRNIGELSPDDGMVAIALEPSYCWTEKRLMQVICFVPSFDKKQRFLDACISTELRPWYWNSGVLDFDEYGNVLLNI